ncbi:hypothetical protein [Nocardia sp. NPDC049149]|uniref:hypothetical protein n=1 Tax=Nocardia sp. NPDC049149 TaxID=3364315 RepID=UPI003721A1A5
MNGTSRKTLGAFAVAAAILTGTLGTVATSTVAQAAPLVAPLHAKAPSTGELRAKVGILLNTGASRSARAAELENGEAGLPVFDRAVELMSIAPASLRWDIVDPVAVSNNQLNAKLRITTEGYEPWVYDVSWRQIDGTWKLTKESVCTVGNMLGAGC